MVALCWPFLARAINIDDYALLNARLPCRTRNSRTTISVLSLGARGNPFERVKREDNRNDQKRPERCATLPNWDLTDALFLSIGTKEGKVTIESHLITSTKSIKIIMCREQIYFKF